MSNYTLIGIPPSAPCYKVALFLSLNEIAFDFKSIALMKGEHKQPDFMEKNRFGQVPALEDKEKGVWLCQSAAILQYLAAKHKKMRGGSAEDKQRVNEWLFWSFDKFCPPIYRLRAQRIGLRSYHQAVAEMYFGEGKMALETVEKHLTGRTFMVGKRMTIADIEIYGVAYLAEAAGHSLKAYPNLAKLLKKIESQKGFKKPTELMHF